MGHLMGVVWSTFKDKVIKEAAEVRTLFSQWGTTSPGTACTDRSGVWQRFLSEVPMAFKGSIEGLQPVSVLGSLVIHLNSIKRIRMCELSGRELSVQGQVVPSPGGWQKYIILEAQEWLLTQIHCGGGWGTCEGWRAESREGLLGRSLQQDGRGVGRSSPVTLCLAKNMQEWFVPHLWWPWLGITLTCPCSQYLCSGLSGLVLAWQRCKARCRALAVALARKAVRRDEGVLVSEWLCTGYMVWCLQLTACLCWKLLFCFQFPFWLICSWGWGL